MLQNAISCINLNEFITKIFQFDVFKLKFPYYFFFLVSAFFVFIQYFFVQKFMLNGVFLCCENASANASFRFGCREFFVLGFWVEGSMDGELFGLISFLVVC
jgi:hypothetical protein